MDLLYITSFNKIAKLTGQKTYFEKLYSVSSLVVPKMEEGISGTGAVKNSK